MARLSFQEHARPEHLNPMGTVHGGWFATLLDSALVALRTAHGTGPRLHHGGAGHQPGQGHHAQVQRVRAEGRVIHSGRQLATAEARLVGPDGNALYAHATTTCLVLTCRHNRRHEILHTMLRVGNLQRSIDFYTRCWACNCCASSKTPNTSIRRCFGL